MRQFLRWLALYVAVGLFLAIGFGVVSEFFIEWAREQGWYVHPSDRLDTWMSAFSSFVTQTWFVSLAAVIIAFAAGIWLDLFLRKREPTNNDREQETAQPSRPPPNSIAVAQNKLSSTEITFLSNLDIMWTNSADRAYTTLSHAFLYKEDKIYTSMAMILDRDKQLMIQMIVRARIANTIDVQHMIYMLDLFIDHYVAAKVAADNLDEKEPKIAAALSDWRSADAQFLGTLKWFIASTPNVDKLGVIMRSLKKFAGSRPQKGT